jgi:type II secretory pathway component PulM
MTTEDDVAALRAKTAHVRAELARVREMIAQLQQRGADLEQRRRPQPSGTDATGGASDTTTDYIGGTIRGGR